MKTKNYFLSLAIAFLLLFGVSANAQLIIYEPASNAQAGGTYTGYDLDLVTPKTASLPTGGLTATNGLPATNSGGNPTGTSTGLRNTWGADTKVVTGLTYANSGGTLSTTGNALNSTASSWGAGKPFVYRWMTTDPFINSRIGGATNGNFGYNAAGSNALYFSTLLNTSDITVNTQLVLGDNGSVNIPIDVSGSQWRFDSQNLGVAVNNTTVFVVAKFTFAASSYTIDVWLNPTLGAALGTATKSIPKASASAGIANVTFRNGNSKLTVDEIRFGLTASDVMPLVTPDIGTGLTIPSSSFSVYQRYAELVVDLNGLTGEQNVTVFDAQGRNVITRQSSGGTKLLMANNLKNGLYIVKVQGADATLTNKLIVK